MEVQHCKSLDISSVLKQLSRHYQNYIHMLGIMQYQKHSNYLDEPDIL